MSMKRYAAFTMMELVVAMLISSMVISIGFYAFSLFSQQLVKRRARSAKVSEYLIFRRAFGRDMDLADAVTDSAEGGPLLLSVDGQELRYSMHGTYILRDKGGLEDTFYLGGGTTAVGYVDSLPLIRSLRFLLFLNGDSVEQGFFKQYTARELMRARNTNHE